MLGEGPLCSSQHRPFPLREIRAGKDRKLMVIRGRGTEAMEVKGKEDLFEPWNLKSAVSGQPFKVSARRHFQYPLTDYSPVDGGGGCGGFCRREEGKGICVFFCFLGFFFKVFHYFVCVCVSPWPSSDSGRGSVNLQLFRHRGRLTLVVMSDAGWFGFSE